MDNHVKEDEVNKAVIYLEECNISGDTMIQMNHCLDDIPKEKQGSIYLHDLLAGYAAATPVDSYTKEDMHKAMNFALTMRDINKKKFPTLNWPETEEKIETVSEEAKKREQIVNAQMKEFFQSLSSTPTPVKESKGDELWDEIKNEFFKLNWAEQCEDAAMENEILLKLKSTYKLSKK